jgi:hypothetical protein
MLEYPLEFRRTDIMRIVFSFAVIIVFSFLSGCKIEAVRPAPTEKIVYMPRAFEDSRIKVNPWRNDDDPSNARDPSFYIPKGPPYPYQLIYNPDTGNYEVVLRKGAPAIEGSTMRYSRSAAPYTIEIPRGQ